MTYQQAFESFMEHDFEEAAISTTKESCFNGHYVVELFKDGSYDIEWCMNTDVYVSEGLVIRVPALNDGEWDEENDEHFFGNAEEYMRDTFAAAIFN